MFGLRVDAADHTFIIAEGEPVFLWVAPVSGRHALNGHCHCDVDLDAPEAIRLRWSERVNKGFRRPVTSRCLGVVSLRCLVLVGVDLRLAELGSGRFQGRVVRLGLAVGTSGVDSGLGRANAPTGDSFPGESSLPFSAA